MGNTRNALNNNLFYRGMYGKPDINTGLLKEWCHYTLNKNQSLSRPGCSKGGWCYPLDISLW